MERGYLVAVLAIIAVFTGLSRGFRSVQNMSAVQVRHFAGFLASRCDSSSAARAAAKLQTHLRPRVAEEAQLLAEMNVPVAGGQSTIAEQMGRQDAAVARCARARALQDAERARRDAWRMQRDMRRASDHERIQPLSLEYLPPDFGQRIQERTAAAVARLAAGNVKLQIVMDRQPHAAMRSSRCASTPE